jgi:hypothetical protein
MVLDFNAELKKFPDNRSLSTIADNIETWLDSLNISAVGAGLVTDNLVLDLPLDTGSGTTAVDRSGNGNDGTIANATWVNGRFGKALNFSGADVDLVTIPHSTDYDLGLNSFSIAFWLKYSDKTINRYIMCKRTPYYWYIRTNTDGEVFGRFRGVNSVGTDINSVRDLSDNSWHFIVIVCGRGSPMKVYVDSVDDTSSGSTIASNVDLSASSSLKINGWEMGGSGKTLKGIFDEFRIYHKALTLLEVNKLYRNTVFDRRHKIKIQHKGGFYEVKVVYV